MSTPRAAAPIGVLGGTFDPVHNGHLKLAAEARAVLGLDHVRFIPVGVPNHRTPPVAGAAARLAMLRATLTDEGFVVDAREIERGGVSYSVETFESLRAQFGPRPLCLILGLDAFNGLCGWHRWRELPSLCHLVVARRPLADAAAIPELATLIDGARVDDPARLWRAPAGLIYFLSVPLLPISSTDIRRRLCAGRPVDHLLPPAVVRIIEREHLYAATNG